MSVATVRAAMGTALRTITSGDIALRVTDYLTDQVTPPHAMFDCEIEPDLSFGRGADVYRFTIWVFVDRTPEVAAQKYIDLLRDPTTSTGLKQTLETDATLAAAVDYVRVTRIGKVEIAPVAGVEYLMVPFDVEVVI